MQKADPLIRTKLRLPIPRPGLVSRARLQEQIAQGLCGPLTLITGPAGFGKTTLVAACVSTCGMPAAWLSLDKNDNQAGRFLTYLTTALQIADPRIGSEAAQLMAGIQPAAPEAVLTSLINDLDALDTDIVLVIDDYQFIASPDIHTELAFILDHCPRNLHLVIASRSDPPLPIARLRARGQLVELRAADLRFTPAEAGQFLNEVMGLHLDVEAVTALEERTEGWIAGMQMAALSMRDRKDIPRFIESFSGTNRYILDYLLEEVLAQQPPEAQRFLLHTAILERLTAPLCDALLAGVDGQEAGAFAFPGTRSPSERQLEYLEHENLFLVPLDDGTSGGTSATWFRYHHLFGDLLKARLQQTQAGWVPLLHARASAWFEQNGLIAEAIQHLLAAQDTDRAADLIERYGPGLWVESDLSVVQMSDSLPREMLIARPKIGLYQAWLLINQGQIEKAAPLLNDIAQHLSGAGAQPEQQWMLTFIQLAFAFLGQRNSPGGFGPLPDGQVLEAFPAGEPVLRDAADILYGMALARRGELDRAAEFSEQYIQKGRAANTAVPTLVPFLATMYLFQGRLHAASALCRQYLGPIKEKGIRVSTAGNLDVILGDVLYARNSLAEAEQHLRAGLRANEPWRNIMTDSFGLLALVNVQKARGDFAGAMQSVEKFASRLQEQTMPVEFREPVRTLRVQVQLASGDLQAAAAWAEQIRLSEDFHQHPQYYLLTLAHISLALGRYAEVDEMLAALPLKDVAGNRVARKIEIQMLRAAALAGLGRKPEALALAESSLTLAEPEGYIQAFLEIGEPARELLAAYLKSSAAAQVLLAAQVQHAAPVQHAQKVLNAFSQASKAKATTPAQTQAGLVEPLSERELEVLQLIALGKTNPEIASQLIVAPGTIKAHAANIYRKLDVTNRTEAVARARQLGILS